VFRFIAAEKANHDIAVMSRVLGVSRAGFYAWERRAPSDRTLQDAFLLDKIRQIHKKSKQTYGSRRIHAELRLEHDIRVGKKRVKRLMADHGLSGSPLRARARARVRVAGVRVAPDLVERDFNPEEPDRCWSADITEIPTWEGKLYLAHVQDLFSRRIVGWSMASHARKELVIDAVEMAVERRRPAKGVIHHSDHGSQGGFNWSSQRLIKERWYGQAERLGISDDGSSGGAVAGAAAGGTQGEPGQVLGSDRAWRDECGCGHRGRGVERRWCPVVSGGWRDAYCHSRAAVGALPVVF
jgi:putative transposase